MEVRLDRIFDFNFLYVMELLIRLFIFRACPSEVLDVELN